MKRKLQYGMATAVALLLLLATLATSALAGGASAGQSLHFGIAGMASNKTMSASELFEALLGTSPTASERAYLDELSGISFYYNDTVPDSEIETSYNGEAGTLSLSMKPYSFVAANGTTVIWIPTYAELNGQKVEFQNSDGGVYRAVLDGLFHTDDFDVKISLYAEIEVGASDVDRLLLASGEAAADALTVIEDYEAAYAVWAEENQKWLAYRAYLEAVAAFEQYGKDLLRYTEVELPAYAEYTRLMEQQKLYDDWEHYKAYDEYLKNGVAKRQEYLTYLAKVEKVTAKLAILENLYVTDSNGWMFYASLMGGTVDMVLQNQDELKFAGILPEDIASAGDSTAALKILLADYDALRVAEYASEHARLTALYAFYTEHYTELREHLCNLYGKLHGFYNNGTVRAAIIAKGKLERYRQFTGILYVTRSCIDDSMTRDGGWFLQDGKSCPLPEIVEAINILPDTNTSSPSGVTMPAEEVARVEEVTPIEKPAKPQPQTRPDPAYMAEPQKPLPVADPNADPAKIPPVAEESAPAPTEPTLHEALVALAADLRAGTLPKREAAGEAKRMTLTTEMNCPVSINNEMTVTFYAADGKTVLDRQKLEYGSRIVYRGPAPTREADAQYVYSFAAWVLSDGSAFEDMILTKNLSLYPYYHTSVRFYTVTWLLDGEQKTQRLAYGELPQSPFATEKTADERYTYAFSGWSPEISPVVGDVTYTGTLNRQERLYTVVFQMGDEKQTQYLPYGALPTPPADTARLPDSYLYEFLAWSPAITGVQGDVTYTAEYRKIPLAVADDATPQAVRHEDGVIVICSDADAIDVREASRYAASVGKALAIEWLGITLRIEADGLSLLNDSFCRKLVAILREDQTLGSYYDVAFCNSMGQVLDLPIPLTVGTADRESGLYLFLNGEWQRAEGSQTLTGGFSLRVCETHSISVDPTENCYISELATKAEAGSLVNLRIGCTFGYHVASARVTKANGEAVEVRDLCFVMPAEAVFVELTVVKTVYRVTFTVDGVVIAQGEYALGEDIEFPETPQKESDDLYDYTFAGWSNELTVAMGDDHAPVFEAIFTATERNIADPFLSDGGSEWLLVTLLVVGIVLLVGGSVGAFFYCRRRKRKAELAKQNAHGTSLEENALDCACARNADATALTAGEPCKADGEGDASAEDCSEA